MLLAENKRFSGVYLLLVVVYLLQSLATTINPTVLSKYHVDVLQIRLLILTIALPYVVIWFMAFIGYLRLTAYAKLIAHEKMEPPLKR
jgi:hypothetical protein